MALRSLCWFVCACVALALTACSGDSGNTSNVDNPLVTDGGTPTVFANFDGVSLPLPNDVTWATDGDPNVELAASPDDSPELAQLKTIVNGLPDLFGLSPHMFLTIPLTGAVDSSTLEMLLFRSDDPQLPVLLNALTQNPPDPTAIGAALAQMELRDQNDFIIRDDPASGVLKLLPKVPFTPGGAYVAVVKTGLLDDNGFPAVSSFTMQALKSTTPFPPGAPYSALEPVRAAFNDGTPSLFDIIAAVTGALNNGASWTRNEVLVTWTYTIANYTLSLTGTGTEDYPGGVAPFTQTTAALKGLSQQFTSNALSWTNPATGADTTGPTPIPASAFLANTGIPSDALGNVYSGKFQSPLLGGNATDTVIFRLVTPASTVAGPGPWPVVVFQHGITSSKDAALPIANSLAAAGYATLAIDAIYHGERTMPGAESGDGFFTTNLLMDRANLYQAAIDLWEAVDVIQAGVDLDGDTINDLDETDVPFIAHSLGSIIGSVFLSQETRVSKMVLSSPSAILVNVLDKTSLPSIQSLVGSLGFTPGTTEYYVFLDLAQWLLDPTDASYNGIGGNPVTRLMNLYAFDDPIVSPASSQAFLSNIGIDPAVTTIVDPDVGGAAAAAGSYQYGLSGKPVVHSFLLSPLFDPALEPWYTGYDPVVQDNATTESQTQVAGYLLTP